MLNCFFVISSYLTENTLCFITCWILNFFALGASLSDNLWPIHSLTHKERYYNYSEGIFMFCRLITRELLFGLILVKCCI